MTCPCLQSLTDTLLYFSKETHQWKMFVNHCLEVVHIHLCNLISTNICIYCTIHNRLHGYIQEQRICKQNGLQSQAEWSIPRQVQILPESSFSALQNLHLHWLQWTSLHSKPVRNFGAMIWNLGQVRDCKSRWRRTMHQDIGWKALCRVCWKRNLITRACCVLKPIYFMSVFSISIYTWYVFLEFLKEVSKPSP